MFDWKTTNQHKGNDILGYPRCAPYDGVGTHSAKLMDNGGSADKDIASDFNHSADSNIVGENGVIADFTVMGNMAVVHKKTVGSNCCGVIDNGSPVCCESFAKGIAIANFQPGYAICIKAGVLWCITQDDMRM